MGLAVLARQLQSCPKKFWIENEPLSSFCFCFWLEIGCFSLSMSFAGLLSTWNGLRLLGYCSWSYIGRGFRFRCAIRAHCACSWCFLCFLVWWCFWFFLFFVFRVLMGAFQCWIIFYANLWELSSLFPPDVISIATSLIFSPSSFPMPAHFNPKSSPHCGPALQQQIPYSNFWIPK